MTTRQEVHKIGIELICRHNPIHMRSTPFLQKIATLQESIKNRCGKGPTVIIGPKKKSGTQCVLEIIRNSEKGVDPCLIKRMTGYSERKISKILYKLFKYGEIRIESGGLYVPVSGS